MKNRKMIVFIITMITILSYSSITSRAAEIIAQGNCGAVGNGSNATWELTNDKVLTIKGYGAMKDYGASDEDHPLWWRDYRKRIDKVVVSGVSRIGAYAFDYCSLKEVEFIGDNLQVIGEGAFGRNDDINSIVLPDSITTIEAYAFNGCRYISELKLPSNLKTIGVQAFDNCGLNLNTLIIPGTIETIPYGAFTWCGYWSGNCRVVINEGVKRINGPNFSRNNRVVFPSSIEYIDNGCFGDELEGCIVYGLNDYTHNWAYNLGIKYVDFTRKYDINNVDFALTQKEYLYTGSKIEPYISVGTIVISDDKSGKFAIDLTEDDYEIFYSDNTNPGIGKVTLVGKGIFEGSTKVTDFNIYDLINNCDISMEYDSVLFDGKEKKPFVNVEYKGGLLVEGTDYEVSYSNNKEEGTATVMITGKGNFKGEVIKNFSIYKYDLIKANVTLSYADVLYDGTAKTPDVTVTFDGKTLEKDKDYSVEIINNTLPGTATVRVTGIGQYSGTVEKSFTITALSIENVDVALKESIYSYDGSPKTPPVEVKLGDKTLIKDTDYILSYENNVNDGTAYAVVTGTGIYKDVIKVSFVILPYNAGMDAVYPEGTLIDDDYVYGVTDDETNEVELFCPANQKIKNVHIPATVADENGTVYTVTSIGNKAFYKNTKITSVVIANTVKSIEDYAFYGCKNIKTLKIGSGVEVIGNSAFRKCTKLTAVTLPKSIDSLGKNCFYGCSKLKTITIDANSVVDVKANAIKGVSKKCVIKVPKKLVKKYKKEFNKKSGFTGGMKVKKK